MYVAAGAHGPERGGVQSEVHFKLDPRLPAAAIDADDDVAVLAPRRVAFGGHGLVGEVFRRPDGGHLGATRPARYNTMMISWIRQQYDRFRQWREASIYGHGFG